MSNKKQVWCGGRGRKGKQGRNVPGVTHKGHTGDMGVDAVGKVPFPDVVRISVCPDTLMWSQEIRISFRRELAQSTRKERLKIKPSGAGMQIENMASIAVPCKGQSQVSLKENSDCSC